MMSVCTLLRMLQTKPSSWFTTKPISLLLHSSKVRSLLAQRKAPISAFSKRLSLKKRRFPTFPKIRLLSPTPGTMKPCSALTPISLVS